MQARRRWLRIAAAVVALFMVRCAAPPPGDGAGAPGLETPADPPFDWDLPPGFPPPAVPPDNPMTTATVELGRRLFYDERLSMDGSYSCASCHQQALAFTDGRGRGIGVTGERHPRGSMSLANVAYAASLTWAHPLLTSLERQAQLPMFGDAPVELGLRSPEELEQLLAQIPEYPALFRAAFPGEPAPLTLLDTCRALASFERSLISGRSGFDRWLMEGDEGAIGEDAKRGFSLFNTEKFECYHCHGGFAFTDHVRFADQAFAQQLYHNTGLYNLDGRGAFPEPNTGVESVS
ncbi:MAG TPA: cytochrome c peroxidase, partial [Polyangiaceae bacterium]|nr:cytochrome c peroxidase [Polyangiaceae bacterium]